MRGVADRAGFRQLAYDAVEGVDPPATFHEIMVRTAAIGAIREVTKWIQDSYTSTYAKCSPN